MRTKTKAAKYFCLTCDKSFPNAQSLGAHNRHHHPKDKAAPRKSPCKDDNGAPPVIRGSFGVPGIVERLEDIVLQNWYLCFLLRRHAALGPDHDIMAAVRLEIIKMENELRELKCEKQTD